MNAGDPPPPASGTTLVVVAGVVYGLFAAGAWLWLALRDREHLLAAEAFGTHGPAAAVAAGAAVGLATCAAARVGERLPALARLRAQLAALLGPLRDGEILWLALSSGVAEELFFRLAMQDALGFWPTSLLFAAFHVAPGVAWIWTVLALAMGALYGWMMVAGFGLASVSIAHALFNYLSLRRMQSP